MLTPEHVRPCMLPLNRDQRFDSHTHAQTCTAGGWELRIWWYLGMKAIMEIKETLHVSQLQVNHSLTHSPAAGMGVCMYVCVLH